MNGIEIYKFKAKDSKKKQGLRTSRTKKARYIKWHETCTCECRLDAIVCNNKQHWNKVKCRCECKELIDKGVCDKDLFGILVTVNVNVINYVILVST